MAYFSYKGRNASGELVQGVVEGVDSAAVATQLFATGVTPVEIGETQRRQADESIGLLQRLTRRPVVHQDEIIACPVHLCEFKNHDTERSVASEK